MSKATDINKFDYSRHEVTKGWTLLLPSTKQECAAFSMQLQNFGGLTPKERGLTVYRN